MKGRTRGESTMRRAFFIGVLSIAWLSLLGQETDYTQKKMVDAFERLKKGDQSGFSKDNFADHHRAASVAILEGSKLPDAWKRSFSIARAVDFERLALIQEGRPANAGSVNESLAGNLITMMRNDDSPTISNEAAGAIRRLFRPSSLERFHDQIKATVDKFKDERGYEIVLLYGEVPSVSLADLEPVISTTKFPYSFYPDCIRARHDDDKAEGRLVMTAKSLTESNPEEIKCLIDALAYPETKGIKAALVSALRSEDFLRMSGGDDVARRDIFAAALVQAMKDEETFPVKEYSGLERTRQLELMERWFKEHWAMKLPGTAFKTLPTPASFQPVR